MGGVRGCPLVVEDDDDIRASMTELLSGEGYAVLEARNGKEALDVLRSSDALPRVILLDLMMPVMSGAEFCAELHQDSRLRNIPVILLSASSQIQKSAEELGAAGVVRKPMSLAALFSVVEQYCVDAGATGDCGPS